MHMPNLKNSHKYDDIINLPHPTSKNHPRMKNIERAAQFSPFAALTGYDSAIKETARITEAHIELDENEKARLNCQIQLLLEKLPTNPFVAITYYVPDSRKDGGAYQTVSGNIKKIDTCERFIVLCDETKIPIDEVIQFESDLFNASYDNNI